MYRKGQASGTVARAQVTPASASKIIAIGKGLTSHDRVDRPTGAISSSTAISRTSAVMPASMRRHSSSSRIACWGSSCQWKRKTSLKSADRSASSADALAVMGLREELNEQGQGEHGPTALAQHCGGDLIGIPGEAVTRWHHLAGQCFDAAEQR